MVVFALHKIGVSEILVKSYAFLMQDKSGIFGVALISAFGSSVFNNLPVVLIGDLTLKEYFENFSFDSLMIYAHLLGKYRPKTYANRFFGNFALAWSFG